MKFTYERIHLQKNMCEIPENFSLRNLWSSGINRNTFKMLHPAVTKLFSALLKKWQLMACSTLVAGWIVLAIENIFYSPKHTRTCILTNILYLNALYKLIKYTYKLYLSISCGACLKTQTLQSNLKTHMHNLSVFKIILPNPAGKDATFFGMAAIYTLKNSTFYYNKPLLNCIKEDRSV